MQPVSDSNPGSPPDMPHALSPDGLGLHPPDGDRRASSPDAAPDTSASSSAAPSGALSSARPTAGQPDDRLEFLSLAAHELRGPLTAVKGYAQLALIAARKDGSFPDRSRRALYAIDHQSSRMADMLAELLDAARIQQGTFEVRPRMMDLSLSVKHLVDQRRLSLEQHTIELDAGHDALMGLWDGPRVEQIVRDLLDNAVRYSPEATRVAISLARVGASAQVCVRDYGIGVRDDERERIFEPFFRGAVAQQRHLSGLGLGLFVGRTVAERLGGRLWVDSLPPDEAGSRFCLDLPLTGA